MVRIFGMRLCTYTAYPYIFYMSAYTLYLHTNTHAHTQNKQGLDEEDSEDNGKMRGRHSSSMNGKMDVHRIRDMKPRTFAELMKICYGVPSVIFPHYSSSSSSSSSCLESSWCCYPYQSIPDTSTTRKVTMMTMMTDTESAQCMMNRVMMRVDLLQAAVVYEMDVLK